MVYSQETELRCHEAGDKDRALKLVSVVIARKISLGFPIALSIVLPSELLDSALSRSILLTLTKIL